MNVGRFRQLVEIQRPAYGREKVDEYGRRVTPWETFEQVRAQAADVSGREFYEAAAHQMQNTVTFTMRSLPGVTLDMRLVMDGVIYEIDQVNHLGYRGDFMRIKAHATDTEGGGQRGQL